MPKVLPPVAVKVPQQEREREKKEEKKVIIQLHEWMRAKSQPALLGRRRPSGRTELSVCL